MSENFAILRLATFTTVSKLTEAEGHNRRLHQPSNVDPHRVHLNRDLLQGEWGAVPYRQRLKTVLHRNAIKPHRHAVLAYEMYFGMSPGAEQSLSVHSWAKETLAYAREVAGNGNLIAFDLHLDETTPHAHAIAIPIVSASRKARGPAPQSGERACRSKPVLSFAEMFGHTSHEVSQCFTRMQDDYAKQMRPFGLKRGTPGGSRKHIPQPELYADSAEVETVSNALRKLLKDPSHLFTGVTRPSMADLSSESCWLAYRERLIRAVSGITQPLLANVDELAKRAKRGVFANVVAQKLASLGKDRDEWTKRAQDAERGQHATLAKHARLEQGMRIFQEAHRPVSPREASELIGAHVTGGRVGQRYVDRVANAKGEILELGLESFRKPDGGELSVFRYLQDELELQSPAAVLLLLEQSVGRARADATLTATVRRAAEIQKVPAPSLKGGDSSVRLQRLQKELEIHLGISTVATSRLIEEQVLTVDGRGRGVLVDRDRGCGCVFDVKAGGCSVIVPPVDAIVRVGAAKTESAVLCDHPDVALKVFDATMGAVCAHLVTAGSVTEPRLNVLKHGHREMLAYASVFAPGWDPSMSVTLLDRERCISAAAELMRGAGRADLRQEIGKRLPGLGM